MPFKALSSLLSNKTFYFQKHKIREKAKKFTWHFVDPPPPPPSRLSCQSRLVIMVEIQFDCRFQTVSSPFKNADYKELQFVGLWQHWMQFQTFCGDGIGLVVAHVIVWNLNISNQWNLKFSKILSFSLFI